MPKIRVRVEFPAGIRKLKKKEADELKELFRTRLANVLGAEAADSLADLGFENVTNHPSGSTKTTKKGAAKKSNK